MRPTTDGAGAADTGPDADAPRHAAKEQAMLDPKEQAKGGFRAHAEREQERRDTLAAARREADAAAGLTPDGAGAGGQADGAPPLELPAADAERSPYAPEGRQPKRWR